MNDVSATPLPKLPLRAPESHKGDFGRVLLVGGSRGMSGAITLAGVAALRSGAGLVTLAVPESIQNVVASYEPSLMTHGLMESTGTILSVEVTTIERLSGASTAIGLGPGIGRQGVDKFVCDVFERIATPQVVDADGLNALAAHPVSLQKPGGPRVLTPHPGEFKRLMQSGDMPTGDDARREAAASLARRDPTGRTVVVLKGHRTVISDGDSFAVNPTGNPGMATGGSGDVLTGIIATLVGQGLEPFDAARLGVYIHGLAGDLAAAGVGQVSLIASDLLQYLPAAFQQFASDRA
jgi:ADP-dependent NAD(P)H-hydrate dehydratase